MSTIMMSDTPLQADSPAQRLRRLAAAVRVHFTWWGTRKTLKPSQSRAFSNGS